MSSLLGICYFTVIAGDAICLILGNGSLLLKTNLGGGGGGYYAVPVTNIVVMKQKLQWQ